VDGVGALGETDGELVKTALLIIATGWKYCNYVQPLLDSANEFFLEGDYEAIVWTDEWNKRWPEAININKEPLGFPGETLYRYHTFANHIPLLRQYDQIFYIDVDMRFVAPVGKEIFSDGITATLHPGFVGTCGTPERSMASTARIPHEWHNEYFCGGFNGGKTQSFVEMTRTIRSSVDVDAMNGITAVWHDESHLNKYLRDIPPAKILDPSYCYPEDAGPHYTDKWKAAGLNVTPKILALNKAGR